MVMLLDAFTTDVDVTVTAKKDAVTITYVNVTADVDVIATTDVSVIVTPVVDIIVTTEADVMVTI
jgi:hypothetical protein